MSNFRVTAQGGLNLRSGPGTTYGDIGDLAFGEIVSSPDTTGWIPIIVAEEDEVEYVAWASGKYLVKDDTPVPVEPATPIPGHVTGKMVVAKAMTQNGDPYVYGAEADPNDPDPDYWDCSELVEWTCSQLGVMPRMPDGASYQYEHCKRYGTIITVEQAVKTTGALLFRLYSTGNHVVVSRGDGSTIEAKGSAYGVGVFSTSGRGWNAAALIPGVTYT